MARAKKGVKRTVRCYLCGHRFEVSTQTMSTACPGCSSAIKVEDLIIKSYVPVNDLQTCGRIKITKRGRVAAKRIRCGDGIECEGAIEGIIETDGDVTLGPKASWRGKALQSRRLHISDGATVDGQLVVPWQRPGEEAFDPDPAPPPAKEKTAPAENVVKKKVARKKVVAKKTTAKKTTVKKTVTRRSASTPAEK
jgi:cytoskeletal protein CcmA (bactofilin family)